MLFRPWAHMFDLLQKYLLNRTNSLKKRRWEHSGTNLEGALCERLRIETLERDSGQEKLWNVAWWRNGIEGTFYILNYFQMTPMFHQRAILIPIQSQECLIRGVCNIRKRPKCTNLFYFYLFYSYNWFVRLRTFSFYSTIFIVLK